ncbi:GNAT family N-acetyltransferase [Gillisia limnaea]|nr:N-acetyltransferase [Gillisia limnaea]
MKKFAEYARENNLKIVPACSYAKKVMEKSSYYDDVLA